ncbi:IS110 family transposase [Streptomyces sp. NPDC057910]|uniref:IS110 family transposase n=1 Tax=Streptomyces sp. NPDC057910 TaxID=3346278 RepID=UPI0036E79C86
MTIAAIDVAKSSGMVCTRVPHEDKPDTRVQRVFNVTATSSAVLELGDHLRCQGITRVVMESTSTYWKIFFFILEAQGIECWLVNARDVKNVPGRPKTDKLDAIWLAKLGERGMVRPSFVPPRPVRQLRDLTRARAVLVHERTRHKQRVEKLLEDAQVKLSVVISDIFGVSGRAMLEAMIAGERSPKTLADLAHGTIKASKDSLVDALTGQFEEHHAYLCKMLLETIDHLSVQIHKLTVRIATRLAELEMTTDNSPDTDDDGPDGQTMLLPLTATERVDEIPGIGPATAQMILAETGLDMSIFPTAGHLVSWARLSPRTLQSGAKNTSGGIGKGNPWLRGALGEAAISASRTDTFLGARYRRIVKRRGHMKALVAVARSILVIVWHLLNDPQARFADLGADFHAKNLDPTRQTRELARKAKALGYNLTLTPATA